MSYQRGRFGFVHLPRPLCPVLLAPVDGDTLPSDVPIILSWTSLPLATSYEVVVSRQDGGASPDLQVEVTGTTASVTGLVKDVVYLWHVNARIGPVISINCQSGARTFTPVENVLLTENGQVFLLENGIALELNP